MHARFSKEKERVERHGQEHLFRFWDDLSLEEKEKLLEHSERIDYGFVNKLYNNCITSKKNDKIENLEKPDLVSRYPESSEHKKAMKLGEDAIGKKELALFVVAGGQGSRLGYSGPKGLYPATPILKKSLFEILAHKILAAEKKYKVEFDWYIMTSEDNNNATIDFFEKNNYFGMRKEQVNFFIQVGALPAVDKNGKILLKSKHEIFFSPNGTGGIYSSLAESGMLDKMKSNDTKYISYFNVDNPLIEPVDPLYLGFHILHSSEISIKTVAKRNAKEPLGVVVKKDGKNIIVEYMNISPEDTEKTTNTGELYFKAGNIAIMMFNTTFIEKIHEEKLIDYSTAALKKVPHLDERGNFITPDKPNAYKFEGFVFDVMPYAKKSLAFETLREEEFAPIKNAEGEDSPAIAYKMQTDLFKKWLLHAGIKDDVVHKLKNVEISPLFATNKEEFKKRVDNNLEEYNKILEEKEEHYFE